MAAAQPAHHQFMRNVVNPTLLGMGLHYVISPFFGRTQSPPVQQLGQFGVVKPFAQAAKQYSAGHQNLYAHHATAAYGDVGANAALRSHGWVRNDKLSGPNHQTMVKNGEAVVAYRGTVITNLGDLAADAMILTGKQKYSSRFYEGVQTAQKAAQTFGKDKVTLTGHSLGGAVAMYAGGEVDLPTIGYNPGTGVAPIKKFMKTIVKPNQKAIIYRVPTDVIAAGAGALGGKIYNIKQTAKNAHTISNFTGPMAAPQTIKAVQTAAMTYRPMKRRP